MDFRQPFWFHRCPRLLLGFGVLNQLGEELRALGVSKPLVVTDAGIVRAGILDMVTKVLEGEKIPYQIFSEVVANPRSQTVHAAADLYRKSGCDGFLSVGGGSSMDTSKGAGIVVNNPGSIMEYEGAEKVKNPIPPHVCIPTTTGTGAEATIFTVITDPDRNYKATIASRLLVPSTAILDPNLVLNLPPAIAASTGIDALTHAIESYTNVTVNPVADCLCLEAISLISNNLRAMVAEPKKHPEACANMLLASTLAGMAFTNTKLGIVHSMAHPIGGFFDTPHGVANAILLPVIMEFNLLGCIDKMIDIAIVMGEDVEGLPDAEAAMLAVEAVKKLSADVGIPPRLRDVGVKDDKFEQMAKDAMLSGNLAVNPRYCTAEIMVELYKKAF